MTNNDVLRTLILLPISLLLIISGYRYLTRTKQILDSLVRKKQVSWFYTKTKIGLYLLKQEENRSDDTSYIMWQKIAAGGHILMGLIIILILILFWTGYIIPSQP